MIPTLYCNLQTGLYQHRYAWTIKAVLFRFLISGMRGTSPLLSAGSLVQERRCQPNTPWDTLLRSAAQPVRPMWRRKSWLPTPSWRWGLDPDRSPVFYLIKFTFVYIVAVHNTSHLTAFYQVRWGLCNSKKINTMIRWSFGSKHLEMMGKKNYLDFVK